MMLCFRQERSWPRVRRTPQMHINYSMMNTTPLTSVQPRTLPYTGTQISSAHDNHIISMQTNFMQLSSACSYQYIILLLNGRNWFVGL